jgi:hypothetical protein
MLACDKYKTIGFPHGITVNDGSWNPATLVAVDMAYGGPCFIVTRDIKGKCGDILDTIAPGLAEIAETFATECHLANDVWSKHGPMVRIESNI